jgi:hypothetical protein
LKIGEGQEQVEAIVIDSPPPDIDGIIGWPALLGKIWLVLWEKETLSRISSLPPEVSSWQRMDLATDVPVAAITSGSPDGGLIYIDTGDSGGVSLSPSGWQEWLSKNPGVPMTIEGGFSPAAGGMFVAEQSWAKELTLGPLTIPRVMVARGVFKWPRLEAVLGLGALKRFEVVLDLQEHKIYLGKRTSPIALPAYNRLGATFPPKSLEAEALEARVLEGGPAYRCGIRHGDRLLKVDDMDMTQWKTNPEIWKRQFWYAKAGTKYRLELERGGRRFFVDVVLEETLPVSDE